MRGRPTVQLAKLIERRTDQGSYLTGVLGTAPIIVIRNGRNNNGDQRWQILLAVPDGADAGTPEHNRRGASWRMARRKAEGVESLGGTEL